MSLSFLFVEYNEVGLCIDGSAGDGANDDTPTTNRVITNTDLSTILYDISTLILDEQSTHSTINSHKKDTTKDSGILSYGSINLFI